MTFNEIQQYIYRRTGHPDTPVAEVSTRVKQFINERYRELLTTPGMEKVRQFTFQFDSNTSDAEYALPQALTRVLSIHERDNDQPLYQMSLQDYRRIDSDPPNFEGTPYAYVMMGSSAVAKQPSDSSELFVLGDTGDTGVFAHLEVIRGQNYPRLVSNIAVDASGSADTGMKDITQVFDFFLTAAPTNGDVTLQTGAADTTGVEIARIPVGSTKVNYRHIALTPKPSDTTTYFVDGEIGITDLVEDNDEPIFHSDFHWVLAEYALHDEYVKKEKQAEADRSLARAIRGEKHFKTYVNNNPDFLPVMGSLANRGTSRLGPFFPADRIIG